MTPVTKWSSANGPAMNGSGDDGRWTDKKYAKSAYLFHKTTTSMKIPYFGTAFFYISSILFILQITFFSLAQGSAQSYDAQFGPKNFSANSSNDMTTISWLQLMEEDANEMSDLRESMHNFEKQPFRYFDSKNPITWVRSYQDALSEQEQGIGRLRRRRDDSGGSGSGEQTTDTVTVSVTSMSTEGSGMDETSGPPTEATMTSTFEASGETTSPIATAETTEDLTVTTATEGSGETMSTTDETTEGSAMTTPEGSGTTMINEITTATSTTGAMSTGSRVTQQAGNICDDCGKNEYCTNEENGVCECKPGFDKGGGTACMPAKQFGGMLHIDVPFDADLNNSSSQAYKDAKKVYTNLLLEAYSFQSWFLSVGIIRFTNGSTIANYELATTNDSDINSTTIQDAFAAFLANETFFANCGCSNVTCESTNLSGTGPVLANDSCNDAGTAFDIVCSSPDVSMFCNSSSTDCIADLDGNVVCGCKDGFYKGQSDRECGITLKKHSCQLILRHSTCFLILATLCVPFTDGVCRNSGTCVETPNGAGLCSCIWGFDGERCQEATWQFILVVVVCSLVFIALIVILVIFLKRRMGYKKEWSSVSGGSYYHNEDAHDSRYTDGYSTLPEWNEPASGVVATSFKTRTDEVYDELTIASGDSDDRNGHGYEGPGAPQQLPLEQWRVSELSKGERIRTDDPLEQQQLPQGEWRVSELSNGERIRTENLGDYYELADQDQKNGVHRGESTESRDQITRI